MKKTIIYSLLLSFFCHFSNAQDQFSTQLNELVIENQRINYLAKSQVNYVLSDSLILNSSGTFTDFLQKNTTIYFKENGYGMVSSPSFRGTTAQQTSVLWNGIKVNSFLLGQSDFNSTAFRNYDDIVIKPGGGGVLFGSAAIGGTIHLNNKLTFNNSTENLISLQYGSFKTKAIQYKFSGSSKNIALNAHFGYNSSDNDYEWIGKNRKNLNGNYFNTNLGFDLGWKINKRNTLELYTSTYNDERFFSLLTPYQTKTKYQNNFYRNLIKWHHKSLGFLNTTSLAYILEDYKYFEALPLDKFSGGLTKSMFFKNESNWIVNANLNFTAFAELQHTIGEGINSSLPKSNQNISALGVLTNYQISDKSGFEIGLKNEFANDYKNPFLYSAGWLYQNSNYELKVNTSKNYRIPTFNDLYWQPGGNLNLKPEISYQFDLNNQLKFKNITISLSTYYNTINDLIRWLPADNGFWDVQNTSKVTIYGAELNFNGSINFNKNRFSYGGNYAYTKSVDQQVSKQLTYTPFHKFNTYFGYHFHKFSISPSFQYIGKIYTTTSNDEESALSSYGVLSIDFQYQFSIKKNPFTLNLRVNNATNTIYTNMPERLMPGRNLYIQLIKKF